MDTQGAHSLGNPPQVDVQLLIIYKQLTRIRQWAAAQSVEIVSEYTDVHSYLKTRKGWQLAIHAVVAGEAEAIVVVSMHCASWNDIILETMKQTGIKIIALNDY